MTFLTLTILTFGVVSNCHCRHSIVTSHTVENALTCKTDN